MRLFLPLAALLAAALIGCGQALTPSAATDAIVPEGGSPAAITLSVAFPTKNALSPQGVPSTVNSVAVTVKQGGNTVLFDGNGNPSKTGAAVTLSPTSPTKSVNLPTGPGYAFEFNALHATTEVAYGTENISSLAANAIIAPKLKTLISSVTLTADKSLYAQNDKARVALSVLAPDGSSVPSGDYTVSYSRSDGASVQGSARGSLVSLGAASVTLTASVAGLKQDRTEGAVDGKLKLVTAAPVVVAGSSYSLMLSGIGLTLAWGDNYYGQLGTGDTTARKAPTAITLPQGVTFTAVDGGGGHSVALGSDGKVYAWGNNSDGELGMGDTTQRKTPTALTTLPQGVTFTVVSAGQAYNLALGSDGKTYAWGQNWAGQLGTGDTTTRKTPTALP